MSLQRRHVNQHRAVWPVPHVLFWPPLPGTCWKHFKGVEREASESFWYWATFNFHAERLRLITFRARAHFGCINGQTFRICSRVPPEIEDQVCRPIIVGTAQHTLRDALASRDLIELDLLVDMDRECNDMFADCVL